MIDISRIIPHLLQQRLTPINGLNNGTGLLKDAEGKVWLFYQERQKIKLFVLILKWCTKCGEDEKGED